MPVVLYQDRRAILLELPIAYSHINTFAQFLNQRKPICPHCRYAKIDPTPSRSNRIKLLVFGYELVRAARIGALGTAANEYLKEVQ